MASTAPTQPEHADHPAWLRAPLLVCGSPIEEALLVALVDAANARRLTAYALDGPRAHPVTRDFGGPLLLIFLQMHSGPYRHDFVLSLTTRTPGASSLLIVECDGHDYHERTKTQAKHDREQDRHVQELGATIFRFTGSELHQDADACADRCLQFLDANLKEAP